MRNHALVLAVAVLALGFAPAPFPKPPRPDGAKEELKKLEGTWLVVRRTRQGSPVPQRGVTTVVIAGDRLQFIVDGMVRTEWTITLDVTKTPRVFDRTKVGKPPGVVLRGIYRLEGDTLTLCYRQEGTAAQRPTDFDASKPGAWLQVSTRKKR